MKKIGIIVAMESEYELVKSVIPNMVIEEHNNISFAVGSIENVQVILIKCGIGKVCSAMGVMELIHNFSPDMIINTGVAGGIDVKTKVMDIVVAESTVYHDVWCGEGNEYGQIQGFPCTFSSDKKLYNLALNINHEGDVYGGLICSGDKFITNKNELAEIKKIFPNALAVDMESCSIAQVCYAYKIPFLSYRIISDTPGVDEHFNQYLNFWEEAPKKSFSMLFSLIESIAKKVNE